MLGVHYLYHQSRHLGLSVVVGPARQGEPCFTGLVENLTLCVNVIKRSFENNSFPLLKVVNLMIFKNVNFSIIFIWEKKRFIFCTFSVG